jgi:two-component system NtrC family response regulator
MDNAQILVVDDELIVCRSVKKILEKDGHNIAMAQRGRDALDLVDNKPFDMLIVDLKMPEMDGIEVLTRVKEKYPDIMVIMITGYATVETAVKAMKMGAFDYIPKPFSPDELSITVEKALETSRLRNENSTLKRQLKGDRFPGIIGSSAGMIEVFSLVEKVAPTSATVMITGESGTGKELIARAIHDLSKRFDKRFVAVDCGAFSSELLKSELFGHTKGAFTGAIATKKGLFDVANGGTIFFDEIANMDLEIQSMILRVLQEREFTPLGGTEPRKVNVRVISATNRDLQRMVDEGNFREDLFYRLYVVPVLLPPLRERKEDIPSLVFHFLRQFSPQKDEHQGIASDALKKLIDHTWPGNVRELENAIQSALVLSAGDRIELGHLPVFHESEEDGTPFRVPETNDELKKMKQKMRQEAVERLEKSFVMHALNQNDWNITRASESVGMQRTNFHALMHKYGIRKQ